MRGVWGQHAGEGSVESDSGRELAERNVSHISRPEAQRTHDTKCSSSDVNLAVSRKLGCAQKPESDVEEEEQRDKSDG